MNKSVKLVIIRNIMDPGGSREETDYPFVGYAPVRDYIPNTVEVNERLTVWRNGHLVMPHDLDTVLVGPGDRLQFNINPGFTALGVGGAITSVGWLAAGINLIGNIAVSAGLSYIASLFVETPKLPDKQASPAYGAGGVRTQNQHGAVIPIIYGRQIAGGNTIRLTTGHANKMTRSSGYNSAFGQSKTNLVLGLCEGPCYSIGGVTRDVTCSRFYSGQKSTTVYSKLGVAPDTNVNIGASSYNQSVGIRLTLEGGKKYVINDVTLSLRRYGALTGQKLRIGVMYGWWPPSGVWLGTPYELDATIVPSSWKEMSIRLPDPVEINPDNNGDWWIVLEPDYGYGSEYLALGSVSGFTSYHGEAYSYDGADWNNTGCMAVAFVGSSETPFENTDGSVKVNGNPIENFTSSGYVSSRLGSAEQEALPGISDLLVERAVDQNLSKNRPIDFSTQNAVDGIGVVLHFPSGWYHQGGSGPSSSQFTAVVRWRITDTTEWTGSQYIAESRFFTNPDAATYRIDFQTEKNAKYAQYRGQALDVQVELLSPETPEQPIVWKSLQEYADDQALTYPYTVLLQLNTDVGTAQGMIENVTALIEGKLVHQYDGGYWSTYGYSRNNAWCALDLALNTRYGGGNHLTLSNVDIDSFEALADYCDESIPDGKGGYMPRWTLDLTIDQVRSFQEWLSTIGAACRSKIFWFGNKLRCKVEKAEDPKMIFTAGNTVAGSFVQTFIGKAKRANVIELKFWDEDLDYAENTATATVEGIRNEGDPDIKETLDLRGCCNLIRAKRAAKYYGNQIRYTNWTAEFDTFISGLGCEPGDVIGLQNDAMDPEGVGGRLYENAPGSTSIILDKDLTIDASGDPYQITVWRELAGVDTLQTATIDESAGTYPAGTTLDITPSWVSTPQAGDVYGVRPIRDNPDNTLPTDAPGVVLARVVTWKQTDDHFVHMMVAQYDERVFDDTPDDTTQPARVETIDGNRIPPRPISMNIKMITQGNKQHALITWKKATWPYPYRCKLWYRQIYPGVPFDRFACIPGAEAVDGEVFYVPDMPEGTAWQVAVCPVAPWTGRHHGPYSDYVTRRRIYVQRAYNDQRRMQVAGIYF